MPNTYSAKDKAEIFGVDIRKTTERMRRPRGVIALLVQSKTVDQAGRRRSPRVDNLAAHAERAILDFVAMHTYDPKRLPQWIAEVVREVLGT